MVAHRRNGNLLIPFPLFVPSSAPSGRSWAELQEDESMRMDRYEKGNVGSGHLALLCSKRDDNLTPRAVGDARAPTFVSFFET